MAILDYVFLGTLVLGMIIGLWKGFVKQILALIGIVVISLGTTYASPVVSELMRDVIIDDGTRAIAAMVITFTVIALIYAIITAIISRAVSKAHVVGGINRFLGALFAMAVVYLLFSILVVLVLGTADDFLVGFKNIAKPPIVESKILTIVYGGTEHPERNFFGNWLLHILQDKINSIIPEIPAA